MRDLIGNLKDKVSLSKLTLLSKPLHIAVLRTTSHSPSTPPTSHHLTTLLSLGNTSRATASIIIHSLIHRLHHTTDSHVALKCLITIHHIIKSGPFILKDQLSLFSSTTSGRNNLKLSSFRDGASPTTWALSAWVRFYSRYIETILSTTKSLGFLISSTSYSILEREKQQDAISSYLNSDLIKDFFSLISIIEEICKLPDNLFVEKNNLLHGVVELLGKDYLLVVNELVVRLSEFKERVGVLSFDDSVELGSGLERLRGCKEKTLQVFLIRKPSVEMLWEMIDELNNKFGFVKMEKLRGSGRGSGSESARFGDRVLVSRDPLKFASGRLRLNSYGV